MTTITEKIHAGEFLLSEANGTRSRDKIVIASGSGVLPAGQVLGKILGSATAAAFGSNTGNGTVGTITLSAGVQVGAYVVTFIEPATNLGTFQVESPTGENVGHGNVGTAFTGGGLSFTIADGATDFVSGDQFKITVATGAGKYGPYSASAADGRATAAAILYDGVDATSADKNAVGITRSVEADANLLTGLDAAARTSLAAAGIIVR